MNIAIVDDHQLIIDGFVNVIHELYPTYQVQIANNKHALFDLLQRDTFDILFLDIKLQHSDARDFIKDIRKQYPNLKIIIISSLSDLPTIETLFKQGVYGYLLKSDPKEEIGRSIESIAQGNPKFVSKGISFQYSAHAITGLKQLILTPREKEVLSLILEGRTTKEVADSLFLAEKTVEKHRANLIMKFEVKNVAALVKKAILDGHL